MILQPGSDIIEQAGGVQKFMRHDGPVITDSGGFQIFSLAYNSVHGDVGEISKSRSESTVASPGGELKRAVPKNDGKGKGVVKVNEEGAVFRSYRDGSWVTLTPESTVQAQKKFGADIIIPLDEVRPGVSIL